MPNAGVVLVPLFIIVFAIISAFMGIHKVEEGHIGVYYRGGALLDGVSHPGLHFMIPWVTQVADVRVTLQTDTVRNVPCGTSGGVMIYFDKIEVVNILNADAAHSTVKDYGVNYDKTWIFDKVHHEINQFCSSHSLQDVYIEKFSLLDEELRVTLQKECTAWKTGITIVSIRVTKPRIPDGVKKNYEEVEQQKTQLMITTQQQTVALKAEETDKMKATIQADKEAEVAIIQAEQEANVAIINAQKEASVSRIKVETSILEKRGEHTREKIENEMHLERQKALADANAFGIELEAEANIKKLTPIYLRSVLYNSLAKPEKVFFGDNIPQMFLDWMPSGEQFLFDELENATAQSEQSAKKETTTAAPKTTKTTQEKKQQPATPKGDLAQESKSVL